MSHIAYSQPTVWLAWARNDEGTEEMIGIYQSQSDADQARKQHEDGRHIEEVIVQRRYEKYKLFKVKLNVVSGDMAVTLPEVVTYPVRRFPDLSAYATPGKIQARLVEEAECALVAENSLNAMQEVYQWWQQNLKGRLHVEQATKYTPYTIVSSTVVQNTATTPAATSA